MMQSHNTEIQQLLGNIQSLAESLPWQWQLMNYDKENSYHQQIVDLYRTANELLKNIYQEQEGRTALTGGQALISH
jgi:hypothetical protein